MFGAERFLWHGLDFVIRLFATLDLEQETQAGVVNAFDCITSATKNKERSFQKKECAVAFNNAPTI
jgi:hypothetical protein